MSIAALKVSVHRAMGSLRKNIEEPDERVTMDTDTLVDRLAQGLEPVRRLRPPG